jgi:hypothetical protein
VEGQDNDEKSEPNPSKPPVVEKIVEAVEEKDKEGGGGEEGAEGG